MTQQELVTLSNLLLKFFGRERKILSLEDRCKIAFVIKTVERRQNGSH
jgi:hypothetical protein